MKVEDWTILFFNLKREHGSKYYWELIKGGVTSESDESGETRGEHSSLTRVSNGKGGWADLILIY